MDSSPGIAAGHWTALERLREIFLSGQPVRGSYWTCREDLEAYDATLGERIGWKWDAVLDQLGRLGWCPPVGPLVDFGCGSGVASRRVLGHGSADRFTEIRLIDKSSLATGFAASRLRNLVPGVRVVEAGSADMADVMAGSTVLLSHVLGEMLPVARRQLASALADAAAVIWVEPGTHADSRALIAMREELLGSFHPVAPCVHAARCGLLAAGQERHWCHFFANPPV
ncbi:MAG: small ribosomal subunit Rsm22 family protein, partial [Verrucomicrobiota bacterium]